MDLQELFFRISNLQKSLIMALACILVLVLFYLAVISGMIDSHVRVEISNLEREIAEQKKKLGEVPVVRASIENYEKQLKDLLYSLPENQDFEALSKQIDRLLTETGVETLRFMPGKETINEDLFIAPMDFQLDVKADYRKIGNFMGRLNSLHRVIDVPKIALRPREKEIAKMSQVAILEAAITGRTYRRLSTEEIKNIEQAKKPVQSGERR
ncbi:MAG: type 4a pilus biogenesis protein PilO [Deltaproteobacteria bacterium]|nr:type 4a pilus biogenesis protein PilO [Deltaproteobacteria bacterium]